MKQIFLYIICAHLASSQQFNPQVESPIGTLIGNSCLPGLDQFLGIPYAKLPLGRLRFANPEPAIDSVDNVIDPTEYSPGCSQEDSFALYNGLHENCLALNAVRPAGTTADANLPVLFWVGKVNHTLALEQR